MLNGGDQRRASYQTKEKNLFHSIGIEITTVALIQRHKLHNQQAIVALTNLNSCFYTNTIKL